MTAVIESGRSTDDLNDSVIRGGGGEVRFPARLPADGWAATSCDREGTWDRVTSVEFVLGTEHAQSDRTRGLRPGSATPRATRSSSPTASVE